MQHGIDGGPVTMAQLNAAALTHECEWRSRVAELRFGFFERLIGRGQPFGPAALDRYGYESAAPQDVRPPIAGEVTEHEDETGFEDQLFIANAGLVLLAPYLPRLFAMLELTGDDGFVDHAAAERAAHLLQYAVTGGTDAPEYELVLNRLLCGISFGRPLARAPDIGDTGREAVDGLLKAVIEHWRALGNTSVEGLRTSFLQREGRLRRVDHGWQLLVESRAFDMLLDGLPWSYKLISYPWMSGVLHVEWR